MLAVDVVRFKPRIPAKICLHQFSRSAIRRAPDEIRAVEFRITSGRARESLLKTRKSWVAQNVILHPDDESMAEYLPFHIFRFKCTARYTAQIGHDYWSNEYDMLQKKYVNKKRTSWSSTNRIHETFNECGAEGTDVNQVYASFKYNAKDVAPMKVGRALEIARPLTDSYIGNKTVGSFQMFRTRAWEIVEQRLNSEEKQKAEDALRMEYLCDQVSGLKLVLTYDDIRHAQVYLPSYVFQVRHFGVKFQRFVSGYDERQIGGEPLYSESRVAAACMATFTVAHGLWTAGSKKLEYAFVPELMYSVSNFVIPVLATGILGCLFSSYKPMVALLWSTRTLKKAEKLNEEHRERTQTHTQEKQHTSTTTTTSRIKAWKFRNPLRPTDPKGYYAMLGVDPTATNAEIKESFRIRALQTHPDRESDPEKKAKATEHFNLLNEAYAVLRNEQERKEYDDGW
ncbi:hypothetical protein SARC_00272 [Sphaeroforma arctica JP610]|uniref:J domain-containing protein n=1 Tax=Sphaeroforma arctica JP610 TaxID=667725 RepID=A0A0L0GF75_9EUKA|nr:hypothetical protein SARC_00272 [Sphaeroforma arctica JP610]XP_014161545.1 hypothetical protein, variant [Sphaeroforma arctica JP610]KNC87642.1 hypothetical protein, variant [Sphaeroforma arctica JP610]KNC87643.1 hypothetical protein SARC_00272 [Sphaeroforma arctica JP610]|eukprot:XP_014161544.1 hypothetical protein SARC_00272 [Sphaeroforma arctica JP610]